MGATATDTGGSIRQPAAVTGTVGIKPTYGRCSRWGIVAFASSLDQAGPIARSVEDAAILLGAMAGHDPKDTTSVDLPVPDYAAAVGKGVKGLTIGIPKEYRVPGMAPEIEALWQQGVAWLKDEGAKIKEVSLKHTKYALPSYYIVAPAEASSNLARYDGVRYGLREKGSDVISMYEKTRAAGFGQEVKRRILIGTYVLSAGYYDAYYLKAQKVRTLIKRDFDQAFGTVDAILTPTTPGPAFALGEKSGDPVEMYLNDIFTVTVNMAGLPGMSVPAGLSSEGTPLGLQLIGKPFDEETLFRVGRVIEAVGRSAVQAARLVEQGRMSEQMTKRLLVSSGSPYEPIVGFCRAVRVGNIVAVSGTTAGSSGKAVAIGDPAAQTRAILETIEKALTEAGASLKDVVRTRIYLTDITHFEAVGRVHGEFFGEIRPANSTFQVTAFVKPEWLVEIEADAVIPAASG